MDLLYLIVGVLAFLAAKNILHVRRLAKRYCRLLDAQRTSSLVLHTVPEKH